MQFVGVFALVFGYAGVYTAVQMLKRPPGGNSGSVLYWVTGIDSLGAPTGSGAKTGAGSGAVSGGPARASSNPPSSPTRTGRGTHSQ